MAWKRRLKIVLRDRPLTKALSLPPGAHRFRLHPYHLPRWQPRLRDRLAEAEPRDGAGASVLYLWSVMMKFLFISPLNSSHSRSNRSSLTLGGTGGRPRTSASGAWLRRGEACSFFAVRFSSLCQPAVPRRFLCCSCCCSGTSSRGTTRRPSSRSLPQWAPRASPASGGASPSGASPRGCRCGGPLLSVLRSLFFADSPRDPPLCPFTCSRA